MVRISRCFEQKDRILVLPDTDLDKTAPPMPLHPGPHVHPAYNYHYFLFPGLPNGLSSPPIPLHPGPVFILLSSTPPPSRSILQIQAPVEVRLRSRISVRSSYSSELISKATGDPTMGSPSPMATRSPWQTGSKTSPPSSNDDGHRLLFS